MGKQHVTRRISMGKCNLCHDTFSKAAMAKHLESCKCRKTVLKTPSNKRGSQKTQIFHLVVEGHGQPEYWMHLEAGARASLEDLDHFLREIWLECCGHLSAFTIQEGTYTSGSLEELDDEGMDIALGGVLRPGMRFYHEYDFGTTTELALRVVSERKGEIRGRSIRLLARNDPPSGTCESCGKIATQVCSQCIYSGRGLHCHKCARKHECGEDMLLPVVNSPRVGMCGYTGPG